MIFTFLIVKIKGSAERLVKSLIDRFTFLIVKIKVYGVRCITAMYGQFTFLIVKIKVEVDLHYMNQFFLIYIPHS